MTVLRGAAPCWCGHDRDDHGAACCWECEWLRDEGDEGAGCDGYEQAPA